MKPSPGHLPAECIGKRVRVRLADGRVAKDVFGPFPSGWAADGRGGCRWSLTGSPFDIAEYELVR